MRLPGTSLQSWNLNWPASFVSLVVSATVLVTLDPRLAVIVLAAVTLPAGITGPQIMQALKEGGCTIMVAVPRLFEKMRRSRLFDGAMSGATVTAMTGIEIALWDVAGKALGLPDAANHFTGRYEFRGKSAAELVKFLTGRGLWFAAATPGE